MRRVVPVLGIIALANSASPFVAHADNNRFNNSVVAGVYTIQHQAGCTNDVFTDPRLQLAAHRHVDDLMANPDLDGHVGSDGSDIRGRAAAAGYRGAASETVTVWPALSISGIDLINQWYHDPADLTIMSNCANSRMGVWSENSLDRTVVVAVYGQPQ